MHAHGQRMQLDDACAAGAFRRAVAAVTVMRPEHRQALLEASDA